MQRIAAMALCLVLVLSLVGCNFCENSNSFTIEELSENIDREPIGNQIPQWVSEVKRNTSFYAVTSSDIDKFDSYAQENFPSFCDARWSQEQSDAVYLGKGIEMFELDNEKQINRIIYYPVVMNGVIVSGYQVYEQLDIHEMGSQAAPFFVNELNNIMELTSENSPLILGFNNDNVIGIVGNTCYVLDSDRMEHKEITLTEIPNISSDIYIDAMEIFCAERTALVEDWVMYDR